MNRQNKRDHYKPRSAASATSNVDTFLEPLTNDVIELFKHKQTFQSNKTSQIEKNIITEF